VFWSDTAFAREVVELPFASLNSGLPAVFGALCTAAIFVVAMVTHLGARYGGVTDLGVKRGPFYVLVGAYMPCVLVETSFLTNPTEGLMNWKFLKLGFWQGCPGTMLGSSTPAPPPIPDGSLTFEMPPMNGV